MRQDGVEQDHRPELQILAIVMIIVACVSIVARFCSRALSPPPAAGNPRWWWDDWTALAATPFVLAQLIMELVMIHLGFGADISGLSREAQLPIFKLLFAFYMIYDIGVSFAKASTLFFLRRAFPTYVSPAWFNIGLWVIHFLNIGWLIGMIFATTFVCDPVAKVWNPFLDGDCVPQASLWIGNAMSSVAIDLLILLLPLPRVWALRVTRLTRLGITIVLGFGYGVILVFIGRSIAAFRSPDDLGRQLSEEAVRVIFWVTAEASMMLLSICVPATLPLGRLLLGSCISPITNKLASRRSDSCSSENNEPFDGPQDEVTLPSLVNSLAGSRAKETEVIHLTYLETVSTKNSPTGTSQII